MTVPIPPAAQKQFYDRLMAGFDGVGVDSHIALEDDVRVLVIAHAAYETNWGTGFAARKANNFWNLTDGQEIDGVAHRVNRWKGEIVRGPDLEFAVGNVKPKKIVQLFCKYRSDNEALHDYFAFLRPQRYTDAVKKLGEADRTFIVDLGAYKRDPKGNLISAWGGALKGGFYTLPIEEYVAGFDPVLNDVLAIQKRTAPGTC